MPEIIDFDYLIRRWPADLPIVVSLFASAFCVAGVGCPWTLP